MPFKNVNPAYYSWANMIHRCNSPSNKFYPKYGGRGISVCDSWKNSFDNFLKDMGERKAGMTLERINVNGNYEPLNCTWADNKTQQRNRTNTKLDRQKVDQIKEELSRLSANKTHIAKQFGVSRALIKKISTGAVWQ